MLSATPLEMMSISPPSRYKRRVANQDRDPLGGAGLRPEAGVERRSVLDAAGLTCRHRNEMKGSASCSHIIDTIITGQS
jgi:hypothetical protein